MCPSELKLYGLLSSSVLRRQKWYDDHDKYWAAAGIELQSAWPQTAKLCDPQWDSRECGMMSPEVKILRRRGVVVNKLVLINSVALHQARFLLGWADR